MTNSLVAKAVAEAKRFLAAAKALEDNGEWCKYIASYYSPRYSGALRRASLDLTRALADMRNRR